jgi:hypothetical membrane protein
VTARDLLRVELVVHQPVGARGDAMKIIRMSLLACGVLASLVYLGADVLAAIRFPAYHSFTDRAISELMATGAPTERLVDPFFLLYGLLMMAFGVGVWMSSPARRARITGGLLLAYAAIGLLGPTVFEMNVRGSGGDVTADLLHIAITAVLVILILFSVGFGSSMAGKSLRSYSVATLLIMVASGMVTSFMAPALGSEQPTPGLGLVERLSIGAFLVWVVVLAISLLRGPATRQAGALMVPGGRGASPPALPAT